MRNKNIILQGSVATKDITRDLWQTPRYILDLVDIFFDYHWFDPCPVNPSFNGLEIDWGNKAYINPPFSQYKLWATKGLSEHYRNSEYGYYPEYIFLSHTNHDVSWYKMLLNRASAIILLDKRVKFVDNKTGLESKNTAIGKCQTLFYLGFRPEQFSNEFKKLGFSFILKDFPYINERIEAN